MALRRKENVEKEIEKTVEESPEAETEAPAKEVAGELVDDTGEMPFQGDEAEAAAEVAEEAEKVDKAKKNSTAATDLIQSKTGGSMATRPSVASDAALSSKLEESGYEGLDDGFGAYPIIALKNEGVFEDTDSEAWGTEFICSILGSKAKFVVANTKCEKRDEQVVYTFDGKVDTQGRPVQETIDEWAEHGWGSEVRPYTDVMAEILEGDRAGEVVILSLPKTSRTKYTGYVKTNMRRFSKEPKDYKTRVYVGDKIQNVDFPYYPWRFKYAGELDA